MRIGIDETGDFNLMSRQFHFVVAVLPRQAATSRFLDWEAGIGDDGRDKGEVKGRLLTEDQLEQFVRRVLRPPPVVRIRPASFMPAQSAEIAGHQSGQANKAHVAAQRCRDAGDDKLAAKATAGAKWLANLSPSNYLWLLAISHTVAHAIYDAIITSHEEWRDSDLREIAILIDQKFINARLGLGAETATTSVFSYLINDLGGGNPRLALVLRKMSLSNHFFAQQYFNAVEQPHKQWHFRPLFEHGCDFKAVSAERPEIRMADIVATIYARANRADASKRAVELHASLAPLVGPSDRATHLLFNP